MSMIFELRQVSLEELEALISDPSDIFFFLSGAEPYQPKRGFWANLFRARKKAVPKREWNAPPEDMLLSLEKNWHILHYLFSDCPWDGPLPQATLMSGGVELGSVDVGYCPARALRTSDVEAFLDFLNALKADEFGVNVSKKDVVDNEIYYSDWEPEHGKLLWEYVVELKNFFQQAREKNNGIILYLY